MGEDFAALHDELRSVARDLLAAVPVESSVDWKLLADSGWLGLEVPEALDGSGATFAEAAVILHEMGRAAASSPYVGSAVLATGALGLLEPGEARDELLCDLASGTIVAALALPGDVACVGGTAAPFEVVGSAGALRVSGSAPFVVDASVASSLLLPGRGPDGQPVLVLLDAASAGVRVTEQPVLDSTRQLADVLVDASIPDQALHRFEGDPHVGLAELHHRAAVAVAIDSLGLAEAMLEATVSYVSVREQFGRPIGSFQAVKHACADMLVKISLSRELVAAAVTAVTAGDPDAGSATSMAKAHATEVAVEVVGAALQLHGGIGYTWESGLHVHLKRAVLNRSLYGSPSAHRRHLALRHT